MSTAPTWAKAFTWIGALTAIAVLAIGTIGIIGTAGDDFDSVRGGRLPGSGAASNPTRRMGTGVVGITAMPASQR